jgi:hypothetical protein
MSTKDEVLGMFDSYNETATSALEAERTGDEYDGYDYASEFLDNWALSLDKSIIVDVMLTVGGPTAYIHCEVSSDGYGTLEVDRATFIASWGSDRRETPLSPSDGLWQVAERYVSGMEA